MRFISHIRRFGVQIQPRRVQYLLNGNEQEVQPMILAEFKYSDVTAEELAFAERVFLGEVNGRTQEIDEFTLTPLLNRLSTYDTEEHAPEFELLDEIWGPVKDYNPEARPHLTHRAFVEAKLLTRQSGDMKLVEELPVTPPWPTYDLFQGSVDDLVAKLLSDGLHLPQAIAYERQNLGRPNVLQGLQEAWEAEQQLPGEVVTA